MIAETFAPAGRMPVVLAGLRFAARPLSPRHVSRLCHDRCRQPRFVPVGRVAPFCHVGAGRRNERPTACPPAVLAEGDLPTNSSGRCSVLAVATTISSTALATCRTTVNIERVDAVGHAVIFRVQAREEMHAGMCRPWRISGRLGPACRASSQGQGPRRPPGRRAVHRRWNRWPS